MKKVFALLFSLGVMTSLFAQNGRGKYDSRDVILVQPDRTVYDNNHRNNNSDYSKRELENRIDRINREYNWRIQEVRKDSYLRKAEKKRQIRALENERDARIRQARDGYYTRNNRWDDRRN